MSRPLDCTVYFNSRLEPAVPPEAGHWIDLAHDPSAAHGLIRLGISPRSDLPAVLLTEPGGKLRAVGLRLAPEEVQRLARGEGLDDGEVTVYSSSWCPDCRRAKRLLAEAGVAFQEVVVDEDLKAEAWILERSGGRRVVPTVAIGRRLFAFNPDPTLLRGLIRHRAPLAS
jgi:glutaredoxin